MYGAEVVKDMGLDKIGTVELITVKSHARQLYLPLDKDLVRAFGIKRGDLLRVKIEGRVKDEGGERDE